MFVHQRAAPPLIGWVQYHNLIIKNRNRWKRWSGTPPDGRKTSNCCCSSTETSWFCCFSFLYFIVNIKKTDTTTKTETLKQCEAVFIFRSEHTENIKCTHKKTFLAYFPYWLKREGRNGCITFAGASFHLPLRCRNKNKIISCSFAEVLYEFKPSTSP